VPCIGTKFIAIMPVTPRPVLGLPPRRETIKNALRDPFGPYPEHDVLLDISNLRQKPLLSLHDLELILDNQPSGYYRLVLFEIAV
jgi:hypothetical protein